MAAAAEQQDVVTEMFTVGGASPLVIMPADDVDRSWVGPTHRRGQLVTDITRAPGGGMPQEDFVKLAEQSGKRRASRWLADGTYRIEMGGDMDCRALETDVTSTAAALGYPHGLKFSHRSTREHGVQARDATRDGLPRALKSTQAGALPAGQWVVTVEAVDADGRATQVMLTRA